MFADEEFSHEMNYLDTAYFFCRVRNLRIYYTLTACKRTSVGGVATLTFTAAL
jgi:hypothetical protein